MEKFIFISAGDLSGDILASRLMKALLKINPNLRFVGIGGNSMIEAGLQSLVPLKDISVVGFWEVAKKYPQFRKLFNQCLEIMHSGNFAGFIPVDYPGFNIKLADKARQMGIPVIYYIAPQLWVWGAGRAKNLAGAVDLILTVFPFETEFFNQYGIKTKYVGHPLLDLPIFDVIPTPCNEREKQIVFLPGSRMQEINRHLQLINEVKDILKKNLPEYRFTVVKSPLIESSLFLKILGNNDWHIADDSRIEMLKSAAGVIKTGTSTLEAALCGLPFAMFYKTSALSYMFGKKLIKLDYLSLANILTDSSLIKEFIQKDATAAAISKEILKIIQDEEYCDNLQKKLLSIRSILGSKGAAATAADIISEELKL